MLFKLKGRGILEIAGYKTDYIGKKEQNNRLKKKSNLPRDTGKKNKSQKEAYKPWRSACIHINALSFSMITLSTVTF